MFVNKRFSPPELRDLTLGCGAFDADDRPTFADILGVLKYINTKMFGGTVRRGRRAAAELGASNDDKTATLVCFSNVIVLVSFI